MSVLCGRYHVSLIAPGLSAGPCRVSNLLGFEQNSGGKEIVAAHGAGERQSDFYLPILAGRRGPTFLLCYSIFGHWRFHRLVAQKRIKSWHW